LRAGGNLGISPAPVVNYPGCRRGEPPNDSDCIDATPAARAKAQTLWNSMAGINGEITALKPALLSPTSTLDYTIDLLQTPNHSTTPIRTLLKISPGGSLYLIAVNLVNDNLDAVIQLPIAVSSVNVQSEARTIATPLSAIRDRFGPFAVHIYQW